MNNFEIVIDVGRILDGKMKVPDLEIFLMDAIRDALDEMAYLIVGKLIENLALYGLGDSSINNDLDIKTFEDGISVVVNNDYYMFVEYGTGVVGDDLSHPQATKHGWMYDINEHGEEGWWYPTIDSDPNPTKYMTETGQLLAWTRGMASRPFMYQTWLWASRTVNNVVNKHINKVFKLLESELNGS